MAALIMQRKILSSLILSCLTIANCYGQRPQTYIGHYTLKTPAKPDTLFDKVNKLRFTLDSTRVYLMAIDNSGQVLWKTDPWKDTGLEAYRVTRPRISKFYFYDWYYGSRKIYYEKLEGKEALEIENNKKKYTAEVIRIIYNNTQFGVVEKETGIFHFMGQD